MDVALYEAVFNMMEGALPEYDLFGETRERTGSNLTGIVPSNTYLTRDGQHVVIGANADSIFKRLMQHDRAGRPRRGSVAGGQRRAREARRRARRARSARGPQRSTPRRC